MDWEALSLATPSPGGVTVSVDSEGDNGRFSGHSFVSVDSTLVTLKEKVPPTDNRPRFADHSCRGGDAACCDLRSSQI